jgi:hypothetical protein
MLFAQAIKDGVTGPDWTGKDYTYKAGEERLLLESQRGYYEQHKDAFTLRYSDSFSTSDSFPQIMGPASVRPFTNLNNGFPAFKLNGQAIGRVYPKNTSGKTIKDPRLTMVGAMQYIENDASGGTVQAFLEYPTGSGQIYNFTFSATSEGTIPTAWPKILESDPLPFDWLPDTEGMLAMSGAGNIPCTYVGDWAINSRSNRDLFIQIASSNKAAMQVNNLTVNQIKNMRMVPTSRAITSATWAATNGGELTLRVWGHGQVSAANVKALVRVSTANINGLYTFSLSAGSDSIIIPMAVDPTNGGTVTVADWGLIEFWGAPAGFAIAVNNGVATVTHTGHGRVPGTWLMFTGFTAAGWNRDWEIDTVIDANTYTIKDIGSLGVPTTYGGVTNAFGAPTGTSQYGFRPWQLVGTHDGNVPFVLCDSTDTTVDLISGSSYLSGMAHRLLGGYPSGAGSQNNDSLALWVAGLFGDHSIRLELARRYHTSFHMHLCLNDAGNFAESTYPNWIANFNTLMNVEPFKTWAAHGKNSVVLSNSGTTTSSDEFSTVDKQSVWVNDVARQRFNDYMNSLMGKVFDRKFDLAALLEPFGQPGKFRVHPRARQIIVSTTANSSLLAIDPSTPIDKSDDGLCLAVRGAGASGGDGTTFLCSIRYRSPTLAIACQNTQQKLTTNATNTVANGVGYLGARHFVQKNSTNSTIHQGQAAFELAEREIGMKRPHK